MMLNNNKLMHAFQWEIVIVNSIAPLSQWLMEFCSIIGIEAALTDC